MRHTTRLGVAAEHQTRAATRSPTGGAAAVRRGHVMLLESQISGTVWIVRHYNSGSGLSRLHERDVRGYVFVDPHAGQHLATRS